MIAVLSSPSRRVAAPIVPGGGNYPAWRVGLEVGVPFTLTGSRPSDATGMTAAFTAGAVHRFTSFATDQVNRKSYSICQGGHDLAHQSGGYAFNWNTKGWELVFPDEPPHASSILGYHPDGIPTDGHGYYGCYIAHLDDGPTWIRVLHGAVGSQSGNVNTVAAWDAINGFAVEDYYPQLPAPQAFTPATGSEFIAGPCACQNPVDEMIYVFRPQPNSSMALTKLNPFTRAWLTIGLSEWYALIGYRGTCVDVSRNRIVMATESADYFVDAWVTFDLATGVPGDLSITGPEAARALLGEGGSALMSNPTLDLYFSLYQDGTLLSVHPTTGYADVYAMLTPSEQSGAFQTAMMLDGLDGIGWISGWLNEVQFLPLA